MAVGQNTRHRNSKAFWKRVVSQPTRYDLVLTAIPLIFVLAVALSAALSVPFLAALAVGAVVSSVVVVDAVFLNPPIESGSGL